MSASQRNDARTIAVAPSLGETLRLQTLLVLEANHEPFDDVRDLEVGELLALAAIWRDAIGVLDVVGWLPAPHAAVIEVVVTAGHIAQLRRLRRDEAAAIVDALELRDGMSAADALAVVDAEIQDRRVAVQGLGEILECYLRAEASGARAHRRCERA